MSNDLLHTDSVGKKDSNTDGIFLLGLWDGNKVSVGKHTEDFPKYELHEESAYHDEKTNFSKQPEHTKSVSVDKKYNQHD